MLRLSFLAALLLTGCNNAGACSSEVLRVARDIGSDRYATTESRNCGATTGYVTMVRVGRASESQDDAVEVFLADSDHGAAIDGGGGTIWTNVVWTAPGRLSVVYATHARLFKQLETAKGASIEYRAGDPIVSPPVP
jgi:hypothetical protein